MEGRSEIIRERVEEFIKEKLGVETKVLWCKRSGKVIIVRLQNEKKKKVTENKSK